MQRFGSAQDRQMLLACFPFSKPERMEGAWITGFETDSFYEGAKASPEYLKLETTPTDLNDARTQHHATLIFGSQFSSNLPVDGKLRAIQLQIVARGEKCPILPPDHTIIVDRVISAKLEAIAG